MIFANVWAFSFFLVVFLMCFLYMAAFRQKSVLMKRIGDPALLGRLIPPLAGRYQRVKSVFVVIAMMFLVLSLAGPRWGQKYQKIKREGIDVIIALDVSKSMLAEDVSPSRLIQAKRELGLLINRLEGDRVGLIAFAGKAFLQCPLTLDYSAARVLLDIMDSDTVPVPGTNIAEALDVARKAFVETEKKHKALILLTDGEDHSGRLSEEIKKAKAAGMKVFSIGFGSPQGEVIPLLDEGGNLKGYKSDKGGQTIVSKLDESGLRNMARQTGGKYYRSTRGEIEVERIINDLKGIEKKTLEDRIYDRYEDRFVWTLVVALILLFLEVLWPEVRGYWPSTMKRFLTSIAQFSRSTIQNARNILSVIFWGLMIMGFIGRPANALGKIPQGNRLYEKGDFKRAEESFQKAVEKNQTDPRANFNLGNAQYQQGDYSSAVDAFETAEGNFRDKNQKSEGAYNAGNAFFKQGNLEEALEKYKLALRWNPSDIEAKHNLEWTRKVLEAQKSQKNKDQPSDEKDRNEDEGENESRDKSKDEKESDEKGKDPQEEEKGDEKDEEISQEKPIKAEMSIQEANRLLNAIEDQEKEARKKLKVFDVPIKVDKDW